ncbi:hypothetical protein A5889_000574 [Enterococcus sp. 9D6_DIV0238]|uniref:Uncharacterized protein n=1 Tax=Candidatus Enterococcus dunnyi TaxID=1834192 RepID=A0A200JGI8_9ENTE|nr:hypothetical protein A5889_001271 [Enterococcus sp. 9D6_DIV0238]
MLYKILLFLFIRMMEDKRLTLLRQQKICYTIESMTYAFNLYGDVTDSTGIVELELRFVGYVYVKTLQLNITAKNENNTFALAA